MRLHKQASTRLYICAPEAPDVHDRSIGGRRDAQELLRFTGQRNDGAGDQLLSWFIGVGLREVLVLIDFELDLP